MSEVELIYLESKGCITDVPRKLDLEVYQAILEAAEQKNERFRFG